LCDKEVLHSGSCVPFEQEEGILLTVGTVLVTVTFLPLALMDLKENAFGQIVGFLVLLITSLQFVVQFCVSGLSMDNVSWWGEDWNGLIGVVLFNFALVIVIPAWLYEREEHVCVGTVVYGSSALALVLYVAIGLLGSMSIHHASDNMLASMMSGAMGSMIQLGASVFAFAIIGLGIPLFSVLTRLNLTGSGLCSTSTGNLLAVYFPFSISWLLYRSSSVATLLSWGGVIFTGLIAFLFPVLLAIYVTRIVDVEGSVSVSFGGFRSKRINLMLLYILLFLIVVSLVVALVGNIID
jgi:hypothetical protein